MKVLTNRGLYPHFSPLEPLKDKWEQYREPRNTLEHYDDQVLGKDSNKNSPGWGLSLSAKQGFSLGTQNKISIDEKSFEQLNQFISEFENAITEIVEPNNTLYRAAKDVGR